MTIDLRKVQTLIEMATDLNKSQMPYSAHWSSHIGWHAKGPGVYIDNLSQSHANAIAAALNQAFMLGAGYQGK